VRIPVEEATEEHLSDADVILLVDPTLPACPEQVWGERNLPAVEAWPTEPYSVKVLEIAIDSNDRECAHHFRTLVSATKGLPGSPRITSPARIIANGAIRLESDRVPTKLMEEFCRLFDQAWGLLPPDHQAEVTRYWRGAVAPECCRQKPNVKDHYDPHVKAHALWGVPKVQMDGQALLFPIVALLDMGEELAVVAIAHELAHVTFYIEGEPNHWPNMRDPVAYAAAEQLVDERLCDWGINAETLRMLDQWGEFRGFSRT
jgi:hypothetical protein